MKANDTTEIVQMHRAVAHFITGALVHARVISGDDFVTDVEHANRIIAALLQKFYSEVTDEDWTDLPFDW